MEHRTEGSLARSAGEDVKERKRLEQCRSKARVKVGKMPKNVVAISGSPRVVATNVCSAFDKLADENDSVISEFKQAFHERSKLAELIEWGGGTVGLMRVLASLLRRVPPATYAGQVNSSSSKNDPSFNNSFKEAVAELTHKDPEALRWFEKNAKHKHLSFLVALRSLLGRYAANKEVYPY